MLHGQLINLSHAAHLDSISSETTAFNVPPHCSGMPSQEDAHHAQLIISTTQPQRDANAPFHAMPQQPSTQPPDNANALPIKREPEEFGVLLTRLASAHLNSHSGTVNIASSAQLEPNSIQMNTNVTTAQTDSLETSAAINAFQAFEHDRFIQLFQLFLFFKLNDLYLETYFILDLMKKINKTTKSENI
jgi:hypothetical protein